MPKVITIPDELFGRLEALARPFIDKEPADVIRWLVEAESKSKSSQKATAPYTQVQPRIERVTIGARAPRERGVTIAMDGSPIHADTVPDLCAKVMNYLFAHKHGAMILSMSPYKTSQDRYLFSKATKHPSGKGFVTPIECHGVYVEAHKSYKTAIEQLARFASKCGVALTYKGT